MAITSDIDSKLLHECFDLHPFDNLMKPEFMNALNKRRQYILQQAAKEAEEQRIFELKRLKEETMKCNIIA